MHYNTVPTHASVLDHQDQAKQGTQHACVTPSTLVATQKTPVPMCEMVLHSVDPWRQLLKVVARLDHSDRYHHAVLCIGIDLHVVARRIPTARLLHHSRRGISRAHSSLLVVLIFLQLRKFLERLR